jgi:glycosyltransferase involved in cell wall biosynthesis
VIYEPQLGIVVPAHNEEENLEVLVSEIREVFDAAACSFELLIVDDGSTDRTTEIIRDLARRDPRIRGLVLTRNFGHQAAISIGLEHARGMAVGIMDADLQDRPSDLLQLYRACRTSKADVAYAVRRTRKEGIFKKLAYRAFYRILERLAQIKIPLDSGDFCVMDRAFLDKLNSLPERLRFVRGLRSWVGGKQIGVEVDRDARRAGAPKYTMARLMRLAIDGLVSFSDVPLRLASVMGFWVSGFSLLGMVIVLIWRATGRLPSGAGLGTIALSIFFLGGVQLLTAGILGEYVGRIFEEVKRRPVALVATEIGGVASTKGVATPRSLAITR